MGEDVTDMATTTSQLQAKLLALTGGQVDIMLDANTFKNSTQILREMADAWEDMNDIQRASALELMGGKRQANTLSALIQNFDTVEKVIETSANSTGSALKENERYLDSIQGKIDQFNNAMQSVWSNILDSDVVKSFVAWGTKIIQSLDTVHGKFLAIAKVLAIFMAYKKINPLDFIKDVSAWMNTIKDGGGLMQYVKSLLGLAPAMKVVTAETIANTVATQMNDAAKAKQMMSDMGLAGVTGTLSAVQKEQAATAILSAMSTGQLTVAQGNAMLAMLGFSGATMAADGSLKVLDATTKGFMATNPVGWILLIVSAIAMVITLISQIPSRTERLTEKLKDLKSELQDIRSDLDSVNSELETTQERMAELLAMDSLTFEEQEELDRLRATNDELERRKELLKDEEKHKSERVGRQAARVVDSSKNDTDWWEKWYITGAIGATSLLNTTEEEEFNVNLADYKKLKAKLDNASSLKKQDKYKKKLDKEAEQIDAYISKLSEALDGVEYGDSEESDAALDYLAELESKYAIARGSQNAKSSAVKGVFAKKEFAETKEAIDKYVDALAKGDANAAIHIDEIINKNADLVEDLEARGVKAQDAVDYFTKLGSEANYATIDGKIKEIDRASAAFESLVSGNTFKVDGIDIGLAELFDEEGKVIQTTLSQIFNDTSDQTRKDITHLLEGSYDQIKNGTVDTERLLTGFGLKATQQVIGIQNKLLGEQNIELFPNLKEEINGIIDTFAEFSKAVGGVVDALDSLEKARAEEAYSGSISIETLENLMKYTDDYTQLVEIDETGAIRLAADAEGILIKQRLEKIKTDAAAAVQTAQANLAQAEYNAKAVNETGPVQEALTAATDGLAGAWAYLGSMIGDIKDGNFSGMFDRASDAYGKVTAGRKEKRAQVNVSVEDAEKALNKALDQQKIANALTSDNVKTKYSSEEASGGNATKEDVEKSALEKLMEDFQRDMDYWENRIAANQARYDQLQNDIDLLESKGQKASTEYYQEQIGLLQEFNDKGVLVGGTMHLLAQKRSEAYTYLKSLEEGSEEWWEVANVINDIESEIDEVTASVVDLQDAMAETEWYKYEEFGNRLDDITSKLETIRDLIAPGGEEEWFDDQGQWTEDGVAVLGTYIQELETYKSGLAETADELKKYNATYSNSTKAYYANLGIHSEQEYYDKVQELTEQQYDYVQSISDTEQSVVDMYESNIDAIEEYTDKLVDSYNDYIDSVKEALDAERDLYNFKKNVQKQTKDIAAIERRIASLSGSTNASDIAERRRLEADLYGAREELDDTYYEHAKETQQEALDNEAEAYEETMNRFIEGLRLGLDQATANMDEFLMSVTSLVTRNAEAVLAKYEETKLPLGDAITNPWKAAIEKVGKYDSDALALINKWTQGGFFDDYKTGVSSDLSSPWNAGSTAADAFKTSVDTVMDDVVAKIQTNVKTASDELSELYSQILDTEKRAQNVNVGGDEPSPTPTPTPTRTPISNATPTAATPKITSATIRPASPTRPTFKKVGGIVAGKGQTGLNIGSRFYSASKFNSLQVEGGDGIYFPYTENGAKNKYVKKGEGYTVTRSGSNYKIDFHSFKPLYTKHAQGTTGTKRDEWAITDEPQFGDELVLVPGKDGNLSFMRKGTGVVPADLTEKIFELAQIPTSDLMSKNMTAIVPNITKNDFKSEVHFDSLVHVDHCDQNTLKDLEKMMDNKINDFSRQMNYSLKKFAR